MSSKTTTILVTLALLVIVANSCLFVVKETEKAVQLRFGRIVEADLKPGLHVKLPLADDVRYFDARILTIDAPSESFITVENKRLIADSYAKWRIRDVEAYYKATGGDERAAEVRIARRINDGLRNQFGVRTLHEVVSGERDQLMINITAEPIHQLTLLQRPMFLINSRLPLITATSFRSRGKPFYVMEAHLLPKLRCQFAEFLNHGSLKRLGILYPSTCVGLRYGY